MPRIEDLVSLLPYYYKTTPFNLARHYRARDILEPFAGELDLIDQIIAEIRLSRSIDDATAYGLDGIADRVGLRREVDESDESLRERIKREIYIQESWGNLEQIKRIVSWFLTDSTGFVRTPEDVIVQDSQDPTSLTMQTAESQGGAHTGTRDVASQDVYIWENEMPWLELEYGADHPQYYSLRMFIEVDVPHTAIPIVTNNAFLFYPDDTIADAEAVNDPVWSQLHGWQSDPESPYGLMSVPSEQADISGIVNEIDRARAGGVEAMLWGYGGFTFYHDDTVADAEVLDDDIHHGWGGKFDGPPRELLLAIENGAADAVSDY